LVSKDGSIDLLSFPRFDSPTIFARLLDHDRGGHFSIRPCLEGGARKQLYLPDTNVLLSRFLSADGVAEVSDFMPVGLSSEDHPRVLVRRVKTVRGTVSFDVEFAPRFDYGRAEHTVEHHDGALVFASKGADGTAVRLRSEVPLTEGGDGTVRATFTLSAGATASFVMEEVLTGSASPSAAPDFVAHAFKDTVNFWHGWIGRAKYGGRWREVVLRSALALKLLVSQTHGSLVAAPTFGLPE